MFFSKRQNYTKLANIVKVLLYERDQYELRVVGAEIVTLSEQLVKVGVRVPLPCANSKEHG